MNKVYIIQWLDIDIQSGCLCGISYVCDTLEQAQSKLKQIEKEEKYRLDDKYTDYTIDKTNDSMLIKFNCSDDNYIRYDIVEKEILKEQNNENN